MFRAPSVALCLCRFAPSSLRRAAAAAAEVAPKAAAAPPPVVKKASAPAADAPVFKEVKFLKEDVASVMAELPEYSFYEMKEYVPNPYIGATMDHSVLVDPPTPERVAPKVEFSKLENGLRVASVDKQGLSASLALYVNAGPRFESPDNFGVSHMVSLMAFKSTAHLSNLRTVKTLEQLGANHTTSCSVGREEIVYKVDVLREFVPLVVPLIVGNVLFPRLLPWEVKSAQEEVTTAIAAKSVDDIMIDMLHRTAYCNNTLGHSTQVGDSGMAHFTPDTIRNYMLDHCAPERMVLVGVNVAHDELSKWAMRAFAEYNTIPLKERPEAKALYTGGDCRQTTAGMSAKTPFCHLALGFESCSWGSSELAALSVLQSLLGGSGSSKLAKEVVATVPGVESCSAFNTVYSDSGLFGVYGVCKPAQAGALTDAVAKTLTSLASASEAEVALAKGTLKGAIYRQMDTKESMVEDLGRQLIMSGRYGSTEEFAKLIDGVTAAQVSAAAKKVLSSKLTAVAYGDTHAVPHYAALEQKMQM